MADWVMPLFTIVVAIALLLETLAIVGAFIAVRRLMRRLEHLADQFQGQFFPRISRLQMWVEEVQPRISGVITEASQAMHSARKQVERTDRVITETSDRLRTKMLYADQRISMALESIETTGARIRRTVTTPVRSAKALLTGIQTGVTSYRRNIRQPVEQVEPTESWPHPRAEAGPNEWLNDRRSSG
jgi:hypothetical protein